VSISLQSLYSRGKALVPTELKAVWAPDVSEKRNISCVAGIQTPDRSARSLVTTPTCHPGCAFTVRYELNL
jgi:hypothetical protein